MKTLLATISVVLVLAGCVSSGPGRVDSAAVPDPRRAAVCIGLDTIDPAQNNGSAGVCLGACLDAMTLAAAFSEHGLSVRLLRDKQATWPGVKNAIRAAAEPLRPGDLLVVTISGHGGQLIDIDGDEADGFDESICLWDGQVRDDDVLAFIATLPAGIRLALISDQCHSEGNFRGLRGLRRPAPAAVAPPAWSGALIQFAGCREAGYSFGTPKGGTWSKALVGTLNLARTWRQWFDLAAARMPDDQVPVWVEFGQVDNAFRNKEPLQ